MSSEAIEPQTTYTMSIQITMSTTAGKAKSGRYDYYDLDVPASGPDVIVDWTSTQGSLDTLADMAHHVVELYGGTVTIMHNSPLAMIRRSESTLDCADDDGH
jgi:hypothetical protein